MPVDTLLLQDLLAEQAQQHIVGRRIPRMQLEALALEVLYGAAPFCQIVGQRLPRVHSWACTGRAHDQLLHQLLNEIQLA